MRIIATQNFRRAWRGLTPQMQRIVASKISQLAENPAHPSLQKHRLRQAKGADIWICYISINKRLLYQYKDGTIYLWDVGEHSIVDKAHL